MGKKSNVKYKKVENSISKVENIINDDKRNNATESK